MDIPVQSCNMIIICQTCGTFMEKFKKCGRCKMVCYCSTECQLSDWSKHKFYCKKPPPPPKEIPSEIPSERGETTAGGSVDTSGSLGDKKDVLTKKVNRSISEIDDDFKLKLYLFRGMIDVKDDDILSKRYDHIFMYNSIDFSCVSVSDHDYLLRYPHCKGLLSREDRRESIIFVYEWYHCGEPYSQATIIKLEDHTSKGVRESELRGNT